MDDLVAAVIVFIAAVLLYVFGLPTTGVCRKEM